MAAITHERGATLRDPSADDRLRRDGFVTFPFLSPAAAAELRAACRALAGPQDEGLVIDYAHADRRRMAEVARLLAPVWEEHLDAVFDDHRVVFCSFVVKHPGPWSTMSLHEDRSLVDERHHRSGTLWIPLVDTAPAIGNGCLSVVPGSHRLGVAMSGTSTPDLYRPYQRTLERHLVPLALDAGQAAFYDARLLHASTHNRTNEPREAIVCALAPRSADLIHVVATGRRRRRIHRVDEAFYIDNAPQALERAVPPEYPVIEQYDEAALEVPAPLVAEVCGPDTVPEVDLVVPPDLEAAWATGPARPSSEFPERVGALLTVPVPPLQAWDSPGPPPTPSSSSRWPPAMLAGPLGPQWSVGDPRAIVTVEHGRTVDGREPPPGPAVGAAALLVLHPGDRLCLRPVGGVAVVDVGEAPPVGSGLVGRGGGALFVPGTSLDLGEGRDQVLWNHGPGPLVVQVRVIAGMTRRDRLAARLRRLVSRGAERRRRAEAAEAARALG